MSSGPSRRKEKPRAASSSCGEDTPRSKSMPSAQPLAEHARRAAEKALRTKLKRGSAIACAARAASGIPVERNQTALRAEPLEDRPAVAAAAEGAIHVQAVRPDRERFERFGRGAPARASAAAHREKSSMPAGGAAGAGERLAELRRPHAGIPELEVVALPDHHRVALELGVLAQRRRTAGCGPSRPASTCSSKPSSSRFHQLACGSKLGNASTLRAHRLPFGAGIDQHAAVRDAR